MSCDKCLHNEVCTALYELNGIPRIGSSQCAFFRDGAKYVEVVCKPGTDVYLARSGRVKEIKIIKELEGLVKFTSCPDYIKNALALIKELTEELEKERTWADSMIDNLRDDIRELTEEKEAAVDDLKRCMYYAEPKRANTCNFCMHDCEVSKDGIQCKGKDKWNYCSPVWRGVVKSKSEGE